MSRSGSWLLTAMLASGLLAAGWTWREPLLRRVLRSVYVVSPQSDPAEATLTLERIAAWDAAGIPLLVEALDSPRPEVTQVAQRLLLERSDVWRWPTTLESGHQLQTLADALADQIEEFQPPARRIAAELAARILRWPIDERYIDRSRIMAACERVLTAGQTLPALPATQPVAEYVPRSPIAVSVRPPRDESPSSGQVLADRLRRQPLPRSESASTTAAPAPLKALALDRAEAKIVLDGSTVVVPVVVPENACRANSALSIASQTNGGPPTGVQTALSDAPVLPDAPLPGQFAAPVRRDEMVVPSSAVEPGPTQPEPEPRSNEVDPYELLTRLHGPDPAARQRAQKELTSRGFKDRDFALAARLVHADVRVRREFVGTLPGMTGIDPATWLLWAARDSEPEIRLEALSLLATTGDPRIMAQVRQLAAKDPDHRVRRLAEQLKSP